MPGDRSEEGVALERIELGLLPRPRGGRARDVSQKRDLAEMLARSEHVRLPAVDLDLDLAGIDDVEAVAVIALAANRLARWNLSPRHAQGESFERGGGQRCEHRDRLQLRELSSRNPDRAVDA